MTKGEAISLCDSGFWKDMTPSDIVMFQLFEERLCMPWAVFQEATEKVLGRPVWTHEFAFSERLQKEFLKERPAPTMQEILDLIPADKRIVVGL